MNRDPIDEMYLSEIFKEQEKNSSSSMSEEAAVPKNETIDPSSGMFLWSDLKDHEFPLVKWRIENLIPLEGFTLLASVSGERKSWIALEAARCVLKGIPFLGKYETVKGSVLYIDMEMSRSEIQRRGKQLGLEESEDTKMVFLSREELNLNDESESEALIADILRLKIGLVIVDTFRAVAGGLKEEKAEEVRAFYNKFRFLKDNGVACLFLDHSRKPNHFEGSKPKKEQVFSSQDKVACVEVLLMIQTDKDAQKINVYQHKNRLGIEQKPFSVIMTDEYGEDGSKITKLEYGGIIDDEAVKKQQAKPLILEILKPGGKTQEEIVEICLKENDIGSKNTREALKELVKEKQLSKSKQGKKNFYSLMDEELDLFLGSVTEEENIIEDD